MAKQSAETQKQKVKEEFFVKVVLMPTGMTHFKSICNKFNGWKKEIDFDNDDEAIEYLTEYFNEGFGEVHEVVKHGDDVFKVTITPKDSGAK